MSVATFHSSSPSIRPKEGIEPASVHLYSLTCTRPDGAARRRPEAASTHRRTDDRESGLTATPRRPRANSIRDRSFVRPQVECQEQAADDKNFELTARVQKYDMFYRVVFLRTAWLILGLFCPHLPHVVCVCVCIRRHRAVVTYLQTTSRVIAAK